MAAMWNLKHRPSIFHFSRYETRAFHFLFRLLLSCCCSTRQMCQIGSEIPVLSEACSFLSGMTPWNFKLLPRKVSKSCKFINVMTDYYHSQQPSAARQDKTKFWLHLWLVSKLPRQVSISGYKTTWFLKSFSQETYSRVLSLDKRLHKGLSHETKSTFKFLADLEAHCAGAKTNKTWENSLVVPSCDVLCHCLPHT